MPLNIYISSAQTPERAIVSGVLGPVNSSLPSIAFGDTIPATVYIVDGAGDYDDVSGAAGYSIKVAIGNRGAQPTSGTFTLTFGGQTTAALAYGATAAQVQAALIALSTIGASDVVVTGSAGSWEVEFTGTLAEAGQSLLTADGDLLSPASTVSISRTQAGGTGVNEKQFILLAQDPAWVDTTWTATTDGWTGTISTNRRGVFDLFTVKSQPIRAYFEVEITDPSGNVRTYCSAPIILLPQIIEGATITTAPPAMAGATRTLANGTGVTITGTTVAVTGCSFGGSAPSNVLVFISPPDATVTVVSGWTLLGTITSTSFSFTLSTLPDNNNYKFTYLPVP